MNEWVKKKKVLEHFKTDALEKQIDLRSDIPEKRLFADLNLKKFSRVLENLISNALKFTGGKGKVRLSLEEKAENVLIMVKDTGIGIPKELQHFLFEKFSRAKRFGLKRQKTPWPWHVHYQTNCGDAWGHH